MTVVDTATGELPLTVHPAAEVFPLLGEEELTDLASDIEANGLRYAVVLDREGRVLDGRNRLAACDLADVAPRFETYAGDDPVAYVVSVNLKRRHLTNGQRAMLAVELLPHFEEQAKQRQGARTDIPAQGRECSTPHREAADDAAKAVGTSGRSVTRAKRIKNADPDLAQQVVEGTVTLRQADDEIAALSPRKAPKSSNVRPYASKAERLEQIRAKASEGYSSHQIADFLDVRAGYIRGMARANNIDIPADRSMGKTSQRVNPAHVVGETVYAMQGIASGLQTLGADCERLADFTVDDWQRCHDEGWVSSLAESRAALTRLINQMREKTQ